jgi:hypothetical protein
MRGHSPIKIEEFKGLWVRGGAETVPMDHFVDCQNIQFQESGFRTREGIGQYAVTGAVSFPNVVRMYTFVRGGVQSILVLDTSGNLFDTGSPTPTTAILSIPAMVDFAFQGVAQRAYISPNDGNLGLQNEFLYVYNGDGSPCRKAAGAGPTTASTLANGAAGHVETGIHIFGVVYETDTGFLTRISPLAQITATGTQQVDLTNVPISPDTFVIKRHVVASKLIDPVFFTGNLEGYQLFFVPGAIIPDNVTTTISVDFYDADLLEDASHLLDAYEEIPAGVFVDTYHERLLVGGLYGVATTVVTTDESVKWATCLVSSPGEPEAISQVDGLIVAPLDGNPLTNAQEYRDVLYIFKSTRTYAYNDNGDVPSSWPLTIIDQGVGASIHGVANVLDSGGVNVEYLLIVDFSGVMIFNGAYQRPELSYKIKDYWMALDRNFFKEIQIMNDSISQKMYITLPSNYILHGDYNNGLDPMNIKWCPWLFEFLTTTITLINTNTLIIGAKQVP